MIGSTTHSEHLGLLLVGHGSREVEGTDEFLELAALVAGQIDSPCEPCFLEFARPTIAEAVDRLAARGIQRLVTVPVLLFAAGHAKRDIPAAVQQATRPHSHLEVEQVAHLGCHPQIIRQSQSRYEEALSAIPAVAGATELILVGRGSHDREATAEMLAFARLRGDLLAGVPAHAAFVSMAEPSLPGILEQAAARGARRIVVQPHLLFDGVLVTRIRETAIEFGKRTGIGCVTTAHLGPSSLVAAAILDRAARASNPV